MVEFGIFGIFLNNLAATFPLSEVVKNIYSLRDRLENGTD